MGEEDNRMMPADFAAAAAVLAVLVLVALVRAALGKTTPDRVVAVDTINTLVTASLVVLGAAFSQVTYIDVALVYAMLSFIATLFISKYLEGGK